MRFEIFIITVSFACMLLGLLLPFWPVAALGMALLVLYGHTTLGVAAGLFFDLILGPPTGPLAFLHFPFLLFAVVCVGLRVLSLRFILPRGDLDTL